MSVRPGAIEQAATQREALSDLLDEADHAPDDARTIADEVRNHYAAAAEELAAGPRRTE